MGNGCDAAENFTVSFNMQNTHMKLIAFQMMASSWIAVRISSDFMILGCSLNVSASSLHGVS